MQELQQYRAIGWDFDGTLMDHPNQSVFWDFIHTNPYGQRHDIVTFRSGGMENTIFFELLQAGSKLVSNHFTNVHTVPHDLWENFHNQTGLILPNTRDPYMDWKSQTCADNGLDILIDDMPYLVKAGCDRLGIAFLHPNDLGYYL